MLRFLADENFNADIVRGLLRRQPDLDIVRLQDVGLEGADDSAILAWASGNRRILLTHDGATVPSSAFAPLARGEKIAGVFLIPQGFPVGQAIDEVLLIAALTHEAEWSDRVVYLPL